MRRRSARTHPKWSGRSHPLHWCKASSRPVPRLPCGNLLKSVRDRDRGAVHRPPASRRCARPQEAPRNTKSKKHKGPVPFGDRACCVRQLGGCTPQASPSPGVVGSSMCASQPNRFDGFVHRPRYMNMTLPPADADGTVNARTKVHRPWTGRVLPRKWCAFMMEPGGRRCSVE